MSEHDIYDSGITSKMFQRSLQKSKRKYDTHDILSSIDYEYDDIDDISIELSRTELTILSTKKKNNKMKEIKESVMNKLYEIVDEDDVELLFDINATKNNISILCKRKIEH